MVKRILLAGGHRDLAVGSAFAQDASCESKAMGKDGKALAGAAENLRS